MDISKKKQLTLKRKFRDFINKVGWKAIITEMKAPQSKFKSVEDLFKVILKHEEYVTSCINELLGKSMESKDHITARFLDWFIE